MSACKAASLKRLRTSGVTFIERLTKPISAVSRGALLAGFVAM